MTNEPDTAPEGEALPAATSIDWDAIRARYEKGEEQVKDIAAHIGMPGIALSRRAKAQGWTLRGTARKAAKGAARLIVRPTKGETTSETIRRLKDLLKDRIARLEAEVKDIGDEVSALTTDKQIRSVNMVVRTLEKVIDLERKDKLARRKAKAAFKLFDEAQRGALADKIDRLEEGWNGATPVAGTGDAGGGGTEPPVALLGAAEPAASAR